MTPEEVDAIAFAGGKPAVDLLGALADQVAVLLERVEELERRDRRDSSNSSQPPSSDSPKSRADRKRLAKEAYRRSMRKTGGQPGHEGKTRELVAADRVDQRFQHLPDRCGCGRCFDGSERRVGDPVVHQQFELPVIRPLVFEHARLRLECPECGKASLASVTAGQQAGFGPRLDAYIALLAGVYRESREDIHRILVDVFAIPACKGSVDNALMRMSAVLADPWRELHAAIRQAEVVHADETTWRLRGAQQYLWVAASALVACFRIDPSRSQAAAKALLGEDFGGFVISDRYAGYHFLDVLQQQLCWCHLIRQLVAVSEYPGPAGRLGAKLVGLGREVLALHRAYLAEDHDADWLAAKLAPLRQEIQGLLERCAAGQHVKTANFAAGLLEEYDALWTFCDVAADLDIDPTNNAAERAVRHAVLMRKIQGGTQSDKGSRWIERIQSVRETCRLQRRSVYDWLTQAATAAHNGHPIPTLLPAPAAQGP